MHASQLYSTSASVVPAEGGERKQVPQSPPCVLLKRGNEFPLSEKRSDFTCGGGIKALIMVFLFPVVGPLWDFQLLPAVEDPEHEMVWLKSLSWPLWGDFKWGMRWRQWRAATAMLPKDLIY